MNFDEGAEEKIEEKGSLTTKLAFEFENFDWPVNLETIV